MGNAVGPGYWLRDRGEGAQPQVNFPLDEHLEGLQSAQPDARPLLEMREIMRLVSAELQRGQGGLGAEELTRSSKTLRHLVHWYLYNGMKSS